MLKRGVYFLANDRVLPLVLAFLNSFRRVNPDIPICFIPFDTNTSRLRSLAEGYHFSVYDDQNMLDRCDAISRAFHPTVKGHYRKLACWEGPFDEFIYIDVDTVVLQNPEFAFRLLDRYDFIVSNSNIPENQHWVWKKTIHATSLLTEDQYAFSANTGFITSKRGMLSVLHAEQALTAAVALKDHMELYCLEQAFLNYLIVSSGHRYTSLWSLLDHPDYHEGYVEYWPGKRTFFQRGEINSIFVKGRNRKVFMVHWAGLYQHNRMDQLLFRILHRAGLKRWIWNVSLFMPLRRFWKYYRDLNERKPGKHKSNQGED